MGSPKTPMSGKGPSAGGTHEKVAYGGTDVHCKFGNAAFMDGGSPLSAGRARV
jgi:hypothetical protein